MLYLIYCADKPDATDLRVTERESHLQYMAEHEEHIVLGGPTLDDSSQTANGTLLIVEFPCIESVHKFLDGDPYHQADLIETRLVKMWQPVRFAPEIVSGALRDGKGAARA